MATWAKIAAQQPQPALVHTPHTQQQKKTPWGNLWPNLHQSRFCVLLAWTVALLLAAVHNTDITTSQSGAVQFFAIVGILVWKAACAAVEYLLLVTHFDLRAEYGLPYQSHAPIQMGLVGASVVYVLRAMLSQENVAMPMVVSEFELSFWVVYWVEWWAGLSVRLGMF
ncbi:hypothetical protein PG995_014657 [Apiospora arundinis]